MKGSEKPRRSFLKSGLLAGAAAWNFVPGKAGGRKSGRAEKNEAWEKRARAYLKSILYTRKQLEDWISGRATLGEAYDSQLGWLFADRRVKHGVDGSISTYRYSGARRTIMYGGNSCRINTYGNSFTHCDQVSDGETWQEVLAAHLCEPLRNFGVGGYSVYQAYLRMKREETRTPSQYIIFNIYDDDHYRNLHGWRNIRLGYTTGMWPAVVGSTMPYVAVNPATGRFAEFGNPCPTPESIHNLSDLDWVFERFKDDFVLKIVLAQRHLGKNSLQASYDLFEMLAREHGLEISIDNPEELRQTAQMLYTRAALFATMRIVEQIEQFASAQEKQLLFVLSYGRRKTAQVLRNLEELYPSTVREASDHPWCTANELTQVEPYQWATGYSDEMTYIFHSLDNARTWLEARPRGRFPIQGGLSTPPHRGTTGRNSALALLRGIQSALFRAKNDLDGLCLALS